MGVSVRQSNSIGVLLCVYWKRACNASARISSVILGRVRLVGEQKRRFPLRFLSFVSYLLAGAFLTNALPHLIVATTGRRNLTPFGPDSSARVNLLWSGINFTSGYLLFRFADRHVGESQENAKAWELPYEIGCFCWSCFGVSYSFFSRSRHLGSKR
jgi:hypothetical protein